jgi:hypothetical protein
MRTRRFIQKNLVCKSDNLVLDNYTKSGFFILFINPPFPESLRRRVPAVEGLCKAQRTMIILRGQKPELGIIHQLEINTV